MRPIGLALLALALAAPAAGAAEPPPLCKALHGLADEARRTGQPQRISLVVGADRRAACEPGSAGAALCAALDGAEPHVAPWLISDCLQTMAADPQITTGAEPSGYRNRRILTHLAAKLGGGVRLDVSYAPAGRYQLVVWRQR